MKFERLYLLMEGVFSLPRHVFQPIVDYYNDAYKQVVKTGIKRITMKTFPPKLFPIDLTGTHYDFLQKHFGEGNLAVWVYVNLDRVKSQFSQYNQNGFDTFNSSRIGNITLDFNDVVRANYDVIEHEMMHYIQYLIRKYKKEKYNQTDPTMGGLPPKHLLPKDINIRGYKHDSLGKSKQKRVNHTNRPIEYYTDLLSAVRQIQYEYKNHQSRGLSKKDFFENVIKTANGEVIGGYASYAPLVEGVFKALKKINGELYQRALKIAYDAFVNKDAPFSRNDLDELKREIKELKQSAREEMTKKDSEKSKEEKVFNNKPALKIEYVDRAIYSHLKDGNYEFAENVFDKLPYTKRIESKREDTEYIVLSSKWPHVQKIFSKIKSLQEAEKDDTFKSNYTFFALRLFLHFMDYVIDPDKKYYSKSERDALIRELYK